MPSRLTILILAFCVASGGCKDKSKSKPTSANTNTNKKVVSTPIIPVVWRPQSKCPDPEVNEFVARAVNYCAQGNYEEYRLLWRYDHQPTSRKRFKRMWEAVETVEVKLVKEILYRDANDLISPPNEYPTYVFHAFIKIKSQALENAEDQLQDRDMILLIVKANNKWHFVPAPDVVKDKMLSPSKLGSSADQSTVQLGQEPTSDKAPETSDSARPEPGEDG